MVRRSKRNRDAGISADDGNAMGLTEAFHPVSADGFTTAMPPVDEGDGSIIGEDVVVDEEGVFEEVDLGDGEVLDDEGLPAGESFPDEAVFEDFYAGRPLDADGADAADASPVPDAVSLGVVTADVAPTKPASKAAHGAKKGDGASRGRHAKHASEMNEKARKKAELPEYMRKSRRMRRILIVVIILLVLILAAMVYFGVQLYKEASSSAVQQALSSEQEVAAIASEDATDSADAAKVTTVPDLVSLLGHTQQEAIDILQHGATAAEPRAVNEEGNPIKSEVRVALTAEPADSRTGYAHGVFGTRRRRQDHSGGLFHVHQLARLRLPQLRRCRAHRAHHREDPGRSRRVGARGRRGAARGRGVLHLLRHRRHDPHQGVLLLQRRGGHRRCAPCLVGGALLRLLHGQRLGQLGRHRPHHLHICKLLEFPLRGSDGNAILGKLSIKRGRKLSTWFGAFQGC